MNKRKIYVVVGETGEYGSKSHKEWRTGAFVNHESARQQIGTFNRFLADNKIPMESQASTCGLAECPSGCPDEWLKGRWCGHGVEYNIEEMTLEE